MAKWYSDDPEYTQISERDNALRTRIESVMKKHATDLSTSHWYGSNYGIREDDLDDVAEEIMTELDLWEKKGGL